MTKKFYNIGLTSTQYYLSQELLKNWTALTMVQYNKAPARNWEVMYGIFEVSTLETAYREPLLKGKAQYCWPPRTNYLRSAAFSTKNFIYLFCKTSYLNVEVNCTEPFPSVSFPRHQAFTMHSTSVAVGSSPSKQAGGQMW
jgi:hypothetical protein